MCGVSLMDRVRNVEVRRRTGVMRELEQCVLRWLGQVERMVKRIVGWDEIGLRLRGRPRRG